MLPLYIIMHATNSSGSTTLYMAIEIKPVYVGFHLGNNFIEDNIIWMCNYVIVNNISCRGPFYLTGDAKQEL